MVAKLYFGGKSFDMAKVTGLGGVFLKCNDPQALAEWYQRHLGINFNGNIYTNFSFIDTDGKLVPGYNVFSFFKKQTSYFDPSNKPFMINFRVEGLYDLLEKLKSEGVEIVGDPVEEDYGKFGWILDLDGNKVELWEPADGSNI